MNSRLRLSLFAIMILSGLVIFGCADMGDRVKNVTAGMTKMIGGNNLPEPIADSIEKMPREAALVARAVEGQLITKRAAVRGVQMTVAAQNRIAQINTLDRSFHRTAAHLYEHHAHPDNPAYAISNGRLVFESNYGHRASVRYNAIFRQSSNIVIIEDAQVSPVYAPTPEPVLFVVDAAKLPRQANGYPQSFAGLMDFVGRRALPPSNTLPPSNQKRDYVIFVFTRDQLSPTAKLKVKVADEGTSLYGYEDSTQYMNFKGWQVAALPGQFALPGTLTTPPLYVKAVFSPGKEAGLLRTPKMVGLYHISGTKSAN